MDIKFTGVNNRGNYDLEEITLEVINDCLLDQYIIRPSNPKEENKESLDNKWDIVFHFVTSIELKKGDKIRILSKSNEIGTYHHKQISDTNKEYIFYFNSETSIWNKYSGAVIYSLQSYKSFFDI